MPYQLVVGGKEAEEGTVSVRKYGEKVSETMKLDDFISYIQEKIASKEA